jgi:hypothetical protein
MKIKNWSKFQHFKDRKPPWVKLYRDVLDDLEWHELDPLASKVLVMCWLIASEDEGRLPNTKTLAFRLRMTEKQTLESINRLSHWLEQDDIDLISEQYQTDSLETERETEKEKRQNTQRGSRLPTDWVLPTTWEDWAKKERPDLNIEKTACYFYDYWIAKPGAGGVKLNWEATWRNWVRSQKQSYKPQDVVHLTTPTPANHDAALRKIEEDRKKAVPIPPEIKAKMEALKRGAV